MQKNNYQFADQSSIMDDSNLSITSNGQKRKCLQDYDVGTSELGSGSYGSVFLVKDKSDGLKYAMKVMNKKNIFKYCTIDNLKREIKIQKKLSHPHTVKLFHFFEDNENVYLILEYAENGSLFSYLRTKKRFTEKEAFVYFFQTILGIDYLHKKSVIHRDLKPENLLIDKDGNIKLCDFGWSAESSSFEKRTTFCGTVDYLAPEMIKNQPHDHSLDIWCTGILLFELLHGYAPFNGNNDQEKCANIVGNQRINFNESISQDCRDLIQSILKQKPQDRLKMTQIFQHPWMKKMEKQYGMQMDHYIYKPQQKVQMQQVELQISPPSPINNQPKYEPKQNLMSKSQVTEEKKFAKEIVTTEQQKKFQEKKNIQAMTTVSRASQRNQFVQKQIKDKNQPEEVKDDGFFTSMFVKLGCIAREKDEKKDNIKK